MFFRLPWLRRFLRKERFEDTKVLELDFLVEEFDSAIADIEDPVRERIQSSLMDCLNPKDLWFLRSKVFSLISQHHCERVAHERVARLDQKLRFFIKRHADHHAEELPSSAMGLS